MAKVQVDLKGVEALERFIKKTKLKISVGILEAEANRGDDINNAELGAVHEFGSLKRGIKSNSFLRVPLKNEFPKKLKDGKMFTDAQFKRLVEKNTPEEIGNKLGGMAVGTIIEAFTTNGFGQWSNKNGPNRKTGQVLVETGQLRDSISYGVKVDK